MLNRTRGALVAATLALTVTLGAGAPVANGLVVDGPTSLRWQPATTGVSGVLASIAACESGGDPTAVSADGLYRGKYQFSRATWRAMGGTGDPAAAPEATQDRLAAKLYAQQGGAPWPNCA